MYINQFKVKYGKPCDISNIELISEDQELSNLFYDDGFKYYMEDKNDVLTMTQTLLEEYLEELTICRDEIDAVFYISENYSTNEHQAKNYSQFVSFRNQLYYTLSSHGLGRAFPYIIGGSGCANLSIALKLGKGLLSAGDHRHILVLFIDKFDEDEKRIMPLVKTNRLAAGTVGSDVSAALLLSSQQLGDRSLHVNDQLKVSQLSMISSYRQMSEGGSQAAYLLETVKGLVNFKKVALKNFNRPMDAYESVYTGNYTHNYFKIYNRQFGWDEDKPNMSSKAQIGHAQSLDSLIAIFGQQNHIENGLIFLIGPCMWSAIDFNYSLS